MKKMDQTSRAGTHEPLALISCARKMKVHAIKDGLGQACCNELRNQANALNVGKLE